MVERTLVDEIISIIHSEANNNPLPVKCTIHETYSNGLVDVLLENGNILTYLPVIGSPRVGDTAVLVYLDDEKTNQIIITNGGGEVDLSNYIQKSSTSGLVKNDGSIDSNEYVTSQELHEAIIDTGWQNVSFLDGYTNSGDNLKIRRIGNIVEIKGIWTVLENKIASLDPVKFATIDEMFRPESNVRVRQQGAGMNTYLLTVDPNGNVYWSRYGTSSSSQLTASNNYLCHALWIVNGGAVGGGSNGTGGSNVDLSNYYTKGELDLLIPNELSDLINDTGFITSSALPSKLSDLTNDTGFITLSALNDYITKDNLSIKYSNEIPTEVDPSEPYSLCIVKSSNGYDVYSIQESSTSLLGDYGKWVKSATIPSDFAVSSHNHNDLYYTKSEVDNMNLGGGGEVDLSNYIQKSSITGLVKNDGSIDSNDYVTSQELPSKTSDLINDSSFTTLEAVYPVGSIYMSVNTVSPSVLFGFGVWEKIEDKFLLGSGATYADGSTGGSADAVIVSHNHTQNSHTHKAHAERRFVMIGNGANWNYSGKIKIRTDGSGTAYYYPHSDKNTDGILENTETESVSPTINSTGEDGTGKNMPPYIAVNIWKRTA